jgi:hypothetical protein
VKLQLEVETNASDKSPGHGSMRGVQSSTSFPAAGKKAGKQETGWADSGSEATRPLDGARKWTGAFSLQQGKTQGKEKLRRRKIER